MKKKLLKIFATATLCCSLFLLGGCSLKEFGKTVLEKGKAFYKEIILGQRETPPENCPKQHFTVETKVKYEGQADVGKQEVCEDGVCVIRAQDTEDYEFWFWEKDGEPISDEAEYIFKPTADETYYAVFKPKNNDYVLINVVYEKDWYANEFYDGISVLGEGYQKKGEELSLLSDGELPVSWFTLRKNWLSSKGERTRGPSLTLSPVRSVTVVVEYEQVCEIVLKETPNCYIFIEEGDVLMNTDEKLSVQMHVEEGYVADYWTVTAYPTPWAEQDDFTVYTWDEGVNWGKDWHYQISIASTYRKIEISLTVTNENLAKPYKVEVIKEKGYSLSCSMSIPEYYISGKDMYGGYYMGIYPSENAYIQDVRVMVGRNVIKAFHGEYTGGLFHIPDAGQAFDGEIVVKINLVSRETHAIVNLISDDDWLDCPPAGNEVTFTPSITTQSFVVKKGEPQEFYMHYTNNLARIYEIGYQFSHISDAKGNVISETIEFAYAPTEDMDLYIRYEEKPVADKYFDYHWSDEGDGYEVRLSQLSVLPYSNCMAEFQEELHIPSTYNGKPVVEISDFGLSYYQVSNNGMRDNYGAYVYGTLYVPSSVKRIGEKAFAAFINKVKIVFEEDAVLEEISPDAFYSKFNSVEVEMTKTQLEGLVKELHERYIGDASRFELHFEPAEHFESEGELGHYETYTEYLCIREESFDFKNISTFDISKIYHEFAHHYQFIAFEGLGEERYETLKIQPTQEEIEGWKTPYDKEDYETYWTHPLEIWARAFAEEWSGYYQG